MEINNVELPDEGNRVSGCKHHHLRVVFLHSSSLTRHSYAHAIALRRLTFTQVQLDNVPTAGCMQVSYSLISLDQVDATQRTVRFALLLESKSSKVSRESWERRSTQSLTDSSVLPVDYVEWKSAASSKFLFLSSDKRKAQRNWHLNGVLQMEKEAAWDQDIGWV